ncbi:hypothetical protein C6W23_09645 [Bacillus atrophaeus]|nr:hypothetical protein C6W23_09645 [Bacillus atrophaeus]
MDKIWFGTSANVIKLFYKEVKPLQYIRACFDQSFFKTCSFLLFFYQCSYFYSKPIHCRAYSGLQRDSLIK